MAFHQNVVTLSSGYKCPALGLGTFRTDPDALSIALKTALLTGYRHVDTAYVYDNEPIIGRSLREIFETGVIKREDIFITTKLPSTCHRPERVIPTLTKQLASLQLDYVDLYLIHNPRSLQYSETSHFPTDESGMLSLDFGTKLEETWACMEDCVRAGLTRSIGVSNMNKNQLKRLLRSGAIKPAMNQIESHPFFQNTPLIDFCHANQIAVTAYAPFGGGKIPYLLTDERLVNIGAKYGKTAAQVCIRWQIDRGNVVIPKSSTPSRVVENFDVWDFELSEEDMLEIARMEINMRIFKGDFPCAKSHPEYPFTELL